MYKCLNVKTSKCKIDNSEFEHFPFIQAYAPRGYFRKLIQMTVAVQTLFFFETRCLGANALWTFSRLGLHKNRSILTQ